jgi:hypothetical protein
MKNITRLALAFALATLAALAPMAHADDEAQLVGSGIPLERQYHYSDKEGPGTMVVKDGPKYSWGRPISVTIYQNGYTYSGKGWRKYASTYPGSTSLFAYCEFWVHGNGLSAKFTGDIAINFGLYEGTYFVNGSGSPYRWYSLIE